MWKLLQNLWLQRRWRRNKPTPWVGATHQQRGCWAEALACKFLQRAGLTLIERNFRYPRGEIDLVMRDRNVLVFVEVRYRRHTRFGGAAASVDAHKQRRLVRAAAFYLQCRMRYQRHPRCRFDVLSITGDHSDADTAMQINWIKQAFDG